MNKTVLKEEVRQAVIHLGLNLIAAYDHVARSNGLTVAQLKAILPMSEGQVTTAGYSTRPAGYVP